MRYSICLSSNALTVFDNPLLGVGGKPAFSKNGLRVPIEAFQGNSRHAMKTSRGGQRDWLAVVVLCYILQIPQALDCLRRYSFANLLPGR